MIDLGIHGKHVRHYSLRYFASSINSYLVYVCLSEIASIVSQRTGTDLRNELFAIFNILGADISHWEQIHW